MRSRLLMGIGTAVLAIAAGGTHFAAASNLTDLTARQELRDCVCIAMADGQITSMERFFILSDAKRVLSPSEYDGLKETMNRLSPMKPVVKRSAPVAQQSVALMRVGSKSYRIVQNGVRVQKSPQTAQRKPSPTVKQEAEAEVVAEDATSSSKAGEAMAISPSRVASTRGTR